MKPTSTQLTELSTLLLTLALSSRAVEMSKGISTGITTMAKAQEESEKSDGEAAEKPEDVPAPGVHDMELGTDFSKCIYKEDDVSYFSAQEPIETLAKGLKTSLLNDQVNAAYLHEIRKENAQLRVDVRSLTKSVKHLSSIVSAGQLHSAELSKSVVSLGQGISEIPAAGGGIPANVRNVLARHLGEQKTSAGESVTIEKKTLAKAVMTNIISPAQNRYFAQTGRFAVKDEANDLILKNIKAMG